MSRGLSKAETQVAVGVVLAAGYLLVGSIEASADHKSEPCAKHPVKLTAAARDRGQATRAQCVGQWNRDHKAWPKNPKDWEIRRRVGEYHWNKAARVANCETGGTRGATRNRGNLNWHPNGTYQGPLGLYRQTAAYGKRVTGYWQPDTWAEWVAVAVASHPITRGWSGWSCGGA